MPSYLLLIVLLQIGQAGKPPAPAPTAQPVTAVEVSHALSAAQLSSVLLQLGADQFSKREAAQARLEAMNDAQVAAAMPQIAAMYRNTRDPEIRMRLRRFGDHCFEYLVLPRYRLAYASGYLGITPARITLGDGTPGIIVADVLANSPARAAGLHRGDEITSVDHKPIPDGDSVGAFIKMIQQRSPNTHVRFTLRRGTQSLTLQAKLGSAPERFKNLSLAKIRRDRIETLHQRWWTEGLMRGRLHPDLPPPPNSDTHLPFLVRKVIAPSTK